MTVSRRTSCRGFEAKTQECILIVGGCNGGPGQSLKKQLVKRTRTRIVRIKVIAKTLKAIHCNDLYTITKVVPNLDLI